MVSWAKLKIRRKSSEEIDRMAASGKILASVFLEVRERLAVFRAQTDPAVALLGRHYPQREVSGVGTPREVAERLNGVLV
jgi:hypothetical protein